jgi:hypothetical protein
MVGTILREFRTVSPFGPMPYPDRDYLRWRTMLQWGRDRCCICGQKPKKLVRDHDHSTNLFRGMLCRPCNAREGCTGDPVFDLWAQLNPAVIFNLKEFQYDRWNYTGRRGVPQPPHYG